MVTIKAVLGTFAGGIMGFYLILFTIAIINGISLRFRGTSIQADINNLTAGA